VILVSPQRKASKSAFIADETSIYEKRHRRETTMAF
jgi:hypothetical protein